MSTSTWTFQRLQKVDDAQIEGLVDVLIDCVQGGASVSFMWPLTRERARAFWQPAHLLDQKGSESKP